MCDIESDATSPPPQKYDWLHVTIMGLEIRKVTGDLMYQINEVERKCRKKEILK